jgi:hypothetical protein
MNDRKTERAVEDFILAADEKTLERMQALIQIRASQIGSPTFDRDSQRLGSEESHLNAWRGRTW